MQTASDLGTREILGIRLRHAVAHGAGIVPPAGPARSSRSRARLVRNLEVAVILAGAGVTLAGILLVSFGATLILTGQDATPRPYPNSQHISTTPNPPRR